VAEKHEVRAELIDELGFALMTPLVIGAGVLLVISNLLVVYGLGPLRQLARDIARREPGATEALDVGTLPRELVPVVSAFNHLMQRVRLALERERRFTDAAAHELRTPLAALKVHADNVARARSEVERTRSMARLQEALARTTNLAGQMLAYSRTQNCADDEECTIVDLARLVREASSALEPLRLLKGQNMAFEGEDSVCIRGQTPKLERLVLNLLDNASRYAPRASAIQVSVRLQDGRAVLAVTNDGEAIPPELRQRVLEPYYRVPGSGSEGSGLGLAIVQEIAEQHGATLEVESVTATRGTIVTVAFPAVSAIEDDRTTTAGRLKDAA
jgi:two-component system sensor histidine kinase QseC